VSDGVAPLVKAVRAVTNLPLAVGFGISTADQVRAVGQLADGVAVGSAIVRTIEENAASGELETRLEALARELASGLPSKNR
jgi:tryptophan synthase alpha chain